MAVLFNNLVYYKCDALTWGPNLQKSCIQGKVWLVNSDTSVCCIRDFKKPTTTYIYQRRFGKANLEIVGDLSKSGWNLINIWEQRQHIGPWHIFAFFDLGGSFILVWNPKSPFPQIKGWGRRGDNAHIWILKNHQSIRWTFGILVVILQLLA